MIRDHDPGGKVRLKLQPHVIGNAGFSPCGKYRAWLGRDWGHPPGGPFALWIGMNPSTADYDVDDPTVRKEQTFTRQLGLSRYIKCNIMDYRATYPSALLTLDVPCHPDNLGVIAVFAQSADKVIVAWGALPKKLQPYADAVVRELGDIPLYCMGKTYSGNPRHPLYLAHSTEMVRWP